MTNSNQAKVTRRKQEILTAAQRVFGSKGYALATMDEIANEANVAKGSVYNYFQSKQDLFNQMFHSSIAEDMARVEELVDLDISARQKLAELLQMSLERTSKYRDLSRLVLEYWVTAIREGGEGIFAASMKELYRNFQQKIEKVLLQGQREEDFALEYGPEVSAALITAMMDGMQIQALLGLRENWTPQYISALEQAILDALRAGKDRSGNGPKKRDADHD